MSRIKSKFFSNNCRNWAIPFNVRTPPIEGQGNPREREGVFKVISEGVAMSVPLISRKHLPFSEGGMRRHFDLFFPKG